MSSRRLIRVSEVLRSELSRLIAKERDLEGTLLTLTQIEVSPDLKQSFIYFSFLNKKEWTEELLLSALNAHKREWQAEIGQKMKTKFTPRLHFRFDDAQERGDRVMQILNSLDTPPPNPDSK